MDDRYRLLLGDCQDVLPTLEAGSVDVCIVDQPYGDTSLSWDVRVDDWLPLVARVLKPSGSLWCFGSMRMFLAQAGYFKDWKMAQDVVWQKNNGSNAFADRFRRVHECIVQFYPAGAPWGDVYKNPVYVFDAEKKQVTRHARPSHWGSIGKGVYSSTAGGRRLERSVLYAKSCKGYAIHPTQKPVEIITPLLQYSCPPGGLVLDPFAGSAAVGAACLEHGRRYIGIERDEGYHAAASRRLAAVAAQGSLFALEEALP